MLWTLPAPVRALLVSHLQLNTRSYSSAVQRADALSILFCGSDEFSIKSLQALHHAQHTVPGLIERIHVAHRPPKPTGRGLKTLREVPISNAARDLSLQTHVFDTFTGWAPPVSYNLVIAVSFGLLVPPRILRLAKYGGLNVHPSLLPDLRGSAPIEHAILKGRTHTGVSIQTLHPSKFDEGVVLAQTPAPGLPIGDRETAVELEGRLAELGAGMLVDVLKETKFVEPLQSAGWYAESKGPTDYAPKITKQDRFVDFSTHTLHHIIAIQRALGDVWCLLPSGERLLVHKVVDADASSASSTTQPGLLVGQRKGELLFRAACGRVGGIWASTYAGGAARKGNSKVLKMLRAQSQL